MPDIQNPEITLANAIASANQNDLKSLLENEQYQKIAYQGLTNAQFRGNVGAVTELLTAMQRLTELRDLAQAVLAIKDHLNYKPLDDAIEKKYKDALPALEQKLKDLDMASRPERGPGVEIVYHPKR